MSGIGVIAGTVSTALFVVSYLPMLIKARRSRDLASYSVANLLLANVGNLVHSVYVFSLPAGPLWALHSFYLVSSGLMLGWWLRYRRADPRDDAASRIRHAYPRGSGLVTGLAGRCGTPASGADG